MQNATDLTLNQSKEHVMDVKIALIGGGNVGQSFLALLRDKQDQIIAEHKISFDLTAICDRKAGSILSVDGLSIKEVLPMLEDGQSLHDYTPEDRTCIKELDPLAVIELSRADVIVECTYSDAKDAEPATTYIQNALSRRKHVITSNKWPIALHYDKLRNLARDKGVKLLFGATVMSGTPLMEILTNPFFSSEVSEIKGALSVSTNILLDNMEQGEIFDDALKDVREKGFLEVDPKLDLEGYDATAKLIILINVLTGQQCSMDKIFREGIQNFTSKDVLNASEKGMRFRLISHAWQGEDCQWEGQVGPFKLNPEDPFYKIMGQRNALKIKNNVLGDIFIEGPGAGKKATGYAILSNMLSIYVRS